MLKPEQKQELQTLTARLNQYVTTDNYAAFDEISDRFQQLLEAWDGSRAHVAHGHYGMSHTAEAAGRRNVSSTLQMGGNKLSE